MAKSHSTSLQIEGPSNFHRGRTDSTQQPEPSSHRQHLREGSSMSRGRTRWPTDEYIQPPRDPAAYETSSAEDFVYPDSHGGFSARTDAGAQSGPGRYQSRMLGDFALQISSPGYASTRGRRRDAREQAARMAREEREALRLQTTNSGQERLNIRQTSSRRHGRDSGCCIIL